MSNSSKKKIQIVSFTTDLKNQSPLDIITIYLNHTKKNSTIIKKKNHSIAFSTHIKKTSSSKTPPQIILICSVTDLSCDYAGIGDVNCYIIFIELEKEESWETFDSILGYICENCEVNKKIYVMGIKRSEEGGGDVYIEKEDVIKVMDKGGFNYEYKEVNLENSDGVIKSINEVLEYCQSHGLHEGEDKEGSRDEGQGKSCCIFWFLLINIKFF